MKSAIARYRHPIQSGAVNPVRSWDGRSTGRLLDSREDHIPLLVMNFDTFALSPTPVHIQTGTDEWLLVPIDGPWKVQATVAGQSARFAGDRTGGPFAAWPAGNPAGCNAQAIYLPRNAAASILGQGEMVAFSAPAFADKPAVCVTCDVARPLLARGASVWRRDVVTLATPADVTTNLVMGETYSPPGLWSGTPLHVHDESGNSQSDHEEIYYHLAADPGGPWGAYGVQMLFDDQGLDRSYVVHHRTAFAIPGAAHPVIAGPNSSMMYVWALASQKPEPLAMLDVPEFAWLKRAGEIIDRLRTSNAPTPLERPQFEKLAADANLTPEQTHVLHFYLQQLNVQVK